MIPSIYLNLEDDAAGILTRIKRLHSKQIILVCPKRCLLFSDSRNLSLLKKHTDKLGKEIFILTMDELGQIYAKEAGFALKQMPTKGGSRKLSDVSLPKTNVFGPPEPVETAIFEQNVISDTVKNLGKIAKKLIPTGSLGLKNEPQVTSTIVEITENQAEDEAQELAVVNEPIFSNVPLPDRAPISVTDNIFPAEIEQAYTEKPKKLYHQRLILGLVACSLVLVLLLGFFVLPKASVVVYPKTESITRDMTVSISPNLKILDTDRLTMPATLVDQSVPVSGSFQSQGKTQVGNKASGTVRIYNFTKQPINLKAATTVFAIGGKTYNLVEDVSGLKPTTYINSKTKEVDPNSLAEPVQIIASAGGDDYNLPSGTRMEITNQVFGSRPQLLYAKTDLEINGGTTRYLSVISQDDYSSAQKQLQDQAFEQVKQKLQASGLILPNGSFSVTINQFSADNAVGTQTPSFQAKLQAQVTGLAIKEDDLNQLVSQRVSQTIQTNKTLRQPPSQLLYQVKDLDLANQLAVLTVHFEGQAVFNLDLSNITPELVGKSREQANEMLNSRAEIDKVEITLAPVWQKKFPLFASKINLSIGSEGQNNP